MPGHCAIGALSPAFILYEKATWEKYLKTKGIAKERMTAEGLSFNFPVADNSTEAGRAQNRRVEIYITANETMVKAAEAAAAQ